MVLLTQHVAVPIASRTATVDLSTEVMGHFVVLRCLCSTALGGPACTERQPLNYIYRYLLFLGECKAALHVGHGMVSSDGKAPVAFFPALTAFVCIEN